MRTSPGRNFGKREVCRAEAQTDELSGVNLFYALRNHTGSHIQRGTSPSHTNYKGAILKRVLLNCFCFLPQSILNVKTATKYVTAPPKGTINVLRFSQLIWKRWSSIAFSLGSAVVQWIGALPLAQEARVQYPVDPRWGC